MPAETCPKCGKFNCASELNYCMYKGCDHAFNDVMGHYKKKVEEPIKVDKSGQTKLF